MRTLTLTALITTVITGMVAITACSKNDATTTDDGEAAIAAVLNLPATPYNYANPTLPAYLTTPQVLGQINTSANNAITDAGATLGRVLFYDKNLSVNNTISCSSCHKADKGFSDNLVLSKGFTGGNTGRHSMQLINAKYYPTGRFFWDERAATLEVQTLLPIQDHVEMGMHLDTLVNKLNKLTYYPPLFQKAFGSTAITSDKISKALAQFVRSIVSYQSKYDAGRQQIAPNQPPTTNFPNFTAEENRGKELFFSPQTACAACHGTETFTAAAPKNNGLDATTTDIGIAVVTNNIADQGLFKVGSLRNIALTAPYMHDGRFATLEEVVEHYNSGVKAHPNLSPQLKTPNGTPRVLNLSVADKAALVAFLKTLTDNTVATEAKYSNPFK